MASLSHVWSLTSSAPGHLVPPAVPTAPRNASRTHRPAGRRSSAGGCGPAKPPAAAAHRSRCPLAACSGFVRRGSPGEKMLGQRGQGHPARRSPRAPPPALGTPLAAARPPSGRRSRGCLRARRPTAAPAAHVRAPALPPAPGLQAPRHPHLWGWRGLLAHG